MKLDLLDMFHALEEFPANTELVEERGPSSLEGQHWLSNATVLLQRLGSRHTIRFQQMADKLASGLGGGAPGPLWHMAQYVLKQAVADLSLRLGQPPEDRPADILDRLELIVSDSRDVAHYLRNRGRSSSSVAVQLLRGLCNELESTCSGNRSRLNRDAEAAVDAVRRLLWEICIHYELIATPGMQSEIAKELSGAHHAQERVIELQRDMVDAFRAMREADAALRAHPLTVNVSQLGTLQTGPNAVTHVAQTAGDQDGPTSSSRS